MRPLHIDMGIYSMKIDQHSFYMPRKRLVHYTTNKPAVDDHVFNPYFA